LQQPRLLPFDVKEAQSNQLFPNETPDPFENQSVGEEKTFEEPDFEEMPIPTAKNDDFVNENSIILIDED